MANSIESTADRGDDPVENAAMGRTDRPRSPFAGPKRVTGDLYGRFSRKSYLQLTSTADPSKLRIDDLWLVGATVSVVVVRTLSFDARALYRINDSNDPTFSFRNLIMAVGLRWER